MSMEDAYYLRKLAELEQQISPRHQLLVRFATAALKGIIANPEHDSRNALYEDTAFEAFEYAQAMMDELDARIIAEECKDD